MGIRPRRSALLVLAALAVVAACGDDDDLRLEDVATSTFAVGPEEDAVTFSLDAHTIDGPDDTTANVILLAGGCRIPGAIEVDGGAVAVAMEPDEAVSVAYEDFGEPCPSVDGGAVALLEATVAWRGDEVGGLVLQAADGTTTALAPVLAGPAHP